LGHTLFASAPKGALPWFILVLLLVQSAQRLGNELQSPELSGFVGALIIIRSQGQSKCSRADHPRR